MATAIVKLPDGRRAKISIPDGMSMEEATGQLQSMYDNSPEAFQGAAPAEPQPAPQAQAPAPMPEQQAPAPEEPGMISKMDQFAKKYIPPYGMTTGMLGAAQGQAPTTELEAYGGGVSRALRDMVAGGRQAFNKITGDEEELARLNEEEALARQEWDERSKEFPLSTGAGRLVGGIGAPVAAAAAAPAGAIAGGAGLGVRALLGAASGGAAGYAQPLTTQEEQGNQRLDNAATGAMVGAAAPIAARGLGKAVRAFRKVDPEEAIEDFAQKQLGATHEKGAESAYRKATGAIDDKLSGLKQEFNKLYDDVENSAKTSIKLNASARLSKEALSLPEEVSNGLSPTARRVAASLEKGATRTSPIVDKAGKPIEEARDVSFKDVRDTIRELRGAKRALPYTDNGIQQSKRIDNIIERLDEDLQAWGKSSDDAAATLRAAREVDARYADEVAPFSSKDEPIGKFRRTMQDEGSFDKNFLKADKGQAMSDLLRRVPEAKPAARELYGQKLLTPSGPTLKRKTLETSTVGEALLSGDERAYLKKVSEAVGNQASSGEIRRSLSGMLRDLGVNKVNKMLQGVEKYGSKEQKASILSDMLRSYAAGKASTEE